MKIPTSPRAFDEIFRALHRSERLEKVFTCPVSDQQYLHWDQLRHRTPPDDLTHEEWWFALKQRRRAHARPVPLVARTPNESDFTYHLPDPITQRLHEIDRWAGGSIEVPEQILNPDTRDRYYVSSLIEEAISSSTLEGATTTRRVAKDMLKTSRAPRDTSERMILNNFLTMRKIRDLREEPLSKELVFELHRLITEQTMSDPTAAGRFRTRDEKVVVVGDHDEILHEPPAAAQLEHRMEMMCDFANDESTEAFLHPALRSIILHFWLAYDHPFCDGNGRTARALFYWAMLRQGYWLFEFISISQIIMEAPARYSHAFLYTETDDNDLTYFILYHVDVVHRAINALRDYLARKSKEIRELEAGIRGLRSLNHRQRAIVSHALRHPDTALTIETHKVSQQVSYQTARTDLLNLRDRELLDGRHVGKRWEFYPPKDLEERLRNLE